jgi:hypothetical protein
MKNSAEQIRVGLATSSGNSQTKVLDGVTSVKILNEKLYDTSSSADAFSSLSAGDVIHVSGFNYAENNRIFTITDVESSGAWIKVDKELKDEKEADVPSAGVTVLKTPESLTINGVTTSDALTDVMNFNAAASSATELDRDYFAITAADTVSSFAATDSGDVIQVTWAKLSAG